MCCIFSSFLSAHPRGAMIDDDDKKLDLAYFNPQDSC